MGVSLHERDHRLKIDGSDTYVPVNGSLITLISFQNCSSVTVGNVTVEDNFECQGVNAQGVETDTKFAVLITYKNNGECQESKDGNTVTKAMIGAVCGAVGLVAAGFVGVWYYQKRLKAREQQDMQTETEVELRA